MSKAIYQTDVYKVCPNETKTGYYLLNKFTGVREGESAFLAVMVVECDTQTQLIAALSGKLGLYTLA